MVVPGTAAPLVEPQRREAQEQFRQLMDHLEQVFWITDIGSGSVTYVSPAYETIWERTCQSLYDEPCTLLDSIHEEDRERMAGVLLGESPSAGYDEEFRILRPDGEIRWIWGRSYPVKDSENHVSRFAGIAEDVTERKKSERERSRLAAIIEYSDDAVLSINVDGIIIGWNSGAERQYGYSAEEVLGRSISRLYPPGHDPDYVRMIGNLVSANEPAKPFDAVRLRKDGTLVHVRVNVAPILDCDGEIVGTSQIARDIAEIRQLEARFIEAQKLDVVGKLAGGIAHDFNNFLAVIMSYAELMTQALDAHAPGRRYAEEIHRAAERAVKLTRQLLVFSRKQAVDPVVLELAEIVGATATMMRRLLAETIEVDVVTHPGSGYIKADSGYVGQLIMNLVINARDAMPEGGKLTIATGRLSIGDDNSEAFPKLSRGEYLVVTVTDTGTGMTDEVRRHLFEPFFTTKAHGTGLGLATCQTIALQSNAQIDVASEPGRGSAFSVYFPRVDDPVESTRPARSGSLTGGTETLLVVEDEPAVLEMLVTVLKSLGYEVLQAVNGQDGLRVALEHTGHPISLVVTDATMPLMNGKVMADWLRATYPGIRVLFTSGYTDEIIAQDGELEPGTAFLAKPYDLAALSGRVRELLDMAY
jgi:two-component system, cell cycle sensor histidine kinase and response regulator CckA